MSIFLLLFVSMFFLHIVDDYYLQGWLADGKNKNWWKKYCPDDMYKYDYVICLLEHGFSNSVLIHIPIFFIANSNFIFLSIIIFTLLHAYIDNLKANKKIINLIGDQVLHIACIIVIIFCFI